MKVQPIEHVSKQYDFDGSEIYNVKTGKTVADISFSEVLHKVVVEDLREEMHKCISLYGLNDIRTLRASQNLNRALNKKSCLSSQK